MEVEKLLQDVLLIVVTGLVIPLAYFGIAWARKKVNQSAFFEKLQIFLMQKRCQPSQTLKVLNTQNAITNRNCLTYLVP